MVRGGVGYQGWQEICSVLLELVCHECLGQSGIWTSFDGELWNANGWLKALKLECKTNRACSTLGQLSFFAQEVTETFLNPAAMATLTGRSHSKHKKSDILGPCNPLSRLEVLGPDRCLQPVGLLPLPSTLELDYVSQPQHPKGAWFIPM